MILTPIPMDRLPGVLAQFAACLKNAFARENFRWIARTESVRAEGMLADRHRREALALAAEFGIETLEGLAAEDFSWDGKRLRADTEAFVLLHEIAHFQLASPDRRGAIDFGHGPGPDTYDRAAAERAAVLPLLERDRDRKSTRLNSSHRL